MTRLMRRSGREEERGQALVLFVILLLVLISTLALVINGGVLRRSDQEQWNALDAGALAGAASLPANPTLARDDALKYARLNHPGLASGSLNVTFRCLVGDRNGDNQPDVGDVPAMCNPGPSPSWTCEGGKCVAQCNPFVAGRTCNTVVLEGTVATDFEFDEVTGVDGATTTNLSAACSGLCGADPTVPLDIGFVIDRTGSMSSSDLTNVKNATLSTLQILDPSKQHVGMAVLGPSKTSAACSGTGHPRGLAADDDEPSTWVAVPYPTHQDLADNYLLPNGSLRTTSQLVRTIQCLDHSSVGTNIGDPLLAMANALRDGGRSGVPKGIILMTDGAANQPTSRSCAYAADRAAQVKAMGIELFTIGFGVVGDRCVERDGPYRRALASRLLADMATGPTTDNGCTDAENADGDHYYCEPRSDSLTSVFRSAASSMLVGAARLINLPG